MPPPAESDPATSIAVRVTIGVAIAVGVFHVASGLAGSSQALLFGDEFHSLRNLHLPYSDLIALFDEHGSGVALTLLQRASVDLFGDGVASYRLPAALGALLALGLVYPVLRCFSGRAVAALAALALATSALHIYYSTFGRIYALVVPAALIAAGALARVLAADAPSKRRYAALVLALAVLPCLHLTALGLVAGLGLAALGTLVSRRASKRTWLATLASFAAGSLLALAFHLPAWSGLSDFVDAKSGAGAGNLVGPLDVAAVVAGGYTSAWIGSALALFGAAALLRKRRTSALVPVCAAFVPVLALFVARPNGLPFAYARYLMAALPFLLLCVACGVYELGLLLFRRRLAALGAGALLLLVHASSGPRGLLERRDGPFIGCETNLVALPAFDTSWDETPPFYSLLAQTDGDVRLIEIPRLPSRANYLYRNSFRQHGKDVRVGTLFDAVRGAPYVTLDGARPDDLDADFLVLHINLEEELERYWRFVFETFQAGDSQLELCMTSQSRSGHVRDKVPGLLETARVLEDRLGPPQHQNRYILVWDLARIERGDQPLELRPTRPERLTGALKRANEISDEGADLAGAGRLEAALAKFDEALALAPDHPPTLSNRAGVLAALGRFDDSARAFERTLELNPWAPDAHFNFGLILMQRGRRGPAAEHLRVAAELDPRLEAEVREILGT